MMQPEQVAKYLQDHPEFFDEYADLLATVYVPHPYGGHAIPLSERQVLSLRDKSRVLEGKLRELVHFGETNDVISDRMHRLALGLMAAGDAATLLACVNHNLREDFGVPGVALRIWGGGAAPAPPEGEEVGPEVRVFAESLSSPYFSERAMFETGAWFGPASEELQSFVYVPLRAEQPLGMLALGSQDPERFTADMGTLYLNRLGELVSMALKRYA
jgi:uncharacterized protein YigA (DUF484 family)